MRKYWQRSLSLLLLMLSFFYVPISLTQADITTADSSNQTQASFSIVATPLALEKITLPSFELKQSGQQQLLNAQKDLTIAVNDQRENQKNSWDLQYQLAAVDQDNQSLQQLSLMLSRDANNSDGLNHHYQMTTQAASAGSNGINSEESYYTIAASQLRLSIPQGTDLSDCQLQQKVTLLDVADPE